MYTRSIVLRGEHCPSLRTLGGTFGVSAEANLVASIEQKYRLDM